MIGDRSRAHRSLSKGGPIKDGASTQVETGHEDMIVGLLTGQQDSASS
jgi:hypothetical protein